MLEMATSTSASASASSRNAGLDTLRAAAIALVFMYHYSIFVSRTATFGWFSDVGWAGVDLFFVLSGYLITQPLLAAARQGRSLSLSTFYARRALRTLPNFYVVLAFYFLLPSLADGRTPPPLWRFLSFTQNYHLQPGTGFSHAWSLCIEEQFYFVLPLVLLLAGFCARRYRLGVAVAWAVLALLVVAAVVTRSLLWLDYGREAGGAIREYYPQVYYATVARCDELLPGVAVALLKNYHPALWQRLLQQGNRLLTVAVAAVCTMFYALHRHYYYDGYGYGYFMTAFGYSLLAWTFAIGVVAALSPRSLLYRWRVPGAATLALWSYAIYLTHKPLEALLHKQLPPLGIDGDAEALCIAIACVACGGLLYRCVEAPFMAVRARWVPKAC